MKAGRISISSPIARALIGKEVGDNIEVVAPGAPRPTRSSRSTGVDGTSTLMVKAKTTYVDPAGVHVIAPNFKIRLSGVTSTIIQLVPVQNRLGQKVAVLGPGLPGDLPHLRFRDLWKLWRPPEGQEGACVARPPQHRNAARHHPARSPAHAAQTRLHLRLAAPAFPLDENFSSDRWMP